MPPRSDQCLKLLMDADQLVLFPRDPSAYQVRIQRSDSNPSLYEILLQNNVVASCKVGPFADFPDVRTNIWSWGPTDAAAALNNLVKNGSREKIGQVLRWEVKSFKYRLLFERVCSLSWDLLRSLAAAGHHRVLLMAPEDAKILHFVEPHHQRQNKLLDVNPTGLGRQSYLMFVPKPGDPANKGQLVQVAELRKYLPDHCTLPQKDDFSVLHGSLSAAAKARGWQLVHVGGEDRFTLMSATGHRVGALGQASYSAAATHGWLQTLKNKKGPGVSFRMGDKNVTPKVMRGYELTVVLTNKLTASQVAVALRLLVGAALLDIRKFHGRSVLCVLQARESPFAAAVELKTCLLRDYGFRPLTCSQQAADVEVVAKVVSRSSDMTCPWPLQ